MNSVVVAVINNELDVVIGRKRLDSPKALAGEWHIPGENIEGAESDEDALKRCGREELGLDIYVSRYMGRTFTPTGKEARWYECFSDSRDIKPSSDLAEAKWIRRSEVRNEVPRYYDWPPGIQNYFKK